MSLKSKILLSCFFLPMVSHSAVEKTLLSPLGYGVDLWAYTQLRGAPLSNLMHKDRDRCRDPVQ